MVGSCVKHLHNQLGSLGRMEGSRCRDWRGPVWSSAGPSLECSLSLSSLETGIQSGGGIQPHVSAKAISSGACDAGTSHPKTEINYSFPAEEQPPPLPHCQRLKGSRNPISDTAQPCRHSTPPTPSQTRGPGPATPQGPSAQQVRRKTTAQPAFG